MKHPSSHRASGAVWVLPVFGVVLATAVGPLGTARAKQGPELAANTSHARREPLHRDIGSVGPTLGVAYPRDRTHSPLSEPVARRLREIAQRGDQRPDVFSKIGASATVNRNFLRCFSGPHVDLDGREHLRATIEHFRDGDPATGWQDPFRRRSESATVGWHAGRAVWGHPPPLVEEIRHADPRFAVVMYGTNDIEQRQPHRYAELMLQLVRTLEGRGVIPLLTTIMPRDDDPGSDRLVDLYNSVVRGIAQMRRLPLIDYHRELARLPDHGLASDRLHPNVHFEGGDPRGCDFTPLGLTHGYNLRNLLTIQALDRVRRVVLAGAPAPDAPAPPPSGRGTLGDPIRARLPFAHAASTARSSQRLFDRYEGCGDADESGPEVVYHLRLDEPARVQAMVIDEGDVDVDLHHLRIEGDGARCVGRADESLELELEAGDHYFVVDSFVDPGGERAGPFLFVAARIDRPSAPPVRED